MYSLHKSRTFLQEKLQNGRTRLEVRRSLKVLLLSLVRRLREETHLTSLKLLFYRVKLDLVIFHSFTSLQLLIVFSPLIYHVCHIFDLFDAKFLRLHLWMDFNYWISQKVHLSFSVPSYRKTETF